MFLAEQMPENHRTGFGNVRMDPNLFSTLSVMRFQAISPVIAEKVDIELITSRSHVANAKAISTLSPLQRFKERVPERNRILD